MSRLERLMPDFRLVVVEGGTHRTTAGHPDFVGMGMKDGYCGPPGESTAAEGEATLETLTGMLVALVRERPGPGGEIGADV